MLYRAFGLKFHLFILILAPVMLTGRLQGQIKAPFLLRYQTSIKGNMTLIANNVVSATATGNYNGTLGNHNVNMVFVDVDNDTTTFNSSNATLVMPAGLICPVMKKVLLYWSAADMEDPGNEPNWNFNQVKLKVPGDTVYTTVSADQVIYQGRLEHFYNDPYTCVKDITGMVAADPAGTYWVANVKAKTGSLTSHGGGNTGCSGGWIIVVVYESTSLPQKNIDIFDGYVHVATQMVPNPLPFNFSGFQTVPTGNVNIDFMFGSLEGDWDLTGDYCEIQKTDGTWLTMSSALRQTNNFFHSIIGLDGAQFLNRVPASQNTLGFDADKFPIPNAGNSVIGNNQTSASIRVGTDQEIYGMFMIGLVVDVWFPEIMTLFTIPAMPGGSGGSVNAGDTLTFSLVAQNNGNDAAANLVLSTTLPPGIDLVQVLPPLPAGVTSNYNLLSKVLTFNIPDSLAEVGDPPFTIQYKAKAITDCILLHDSLYRHGSCQVTASYHGVVNSTPQLNLSSTALTTCGTGNLAPALFNIIPPLSFPVAINDSALTPEDTPVAIHVLVNDTDCDHNINSGNLNIVYGPHHGTATVLHSSGYILYTPAANYYGPDTLRYRICDFDNQCDTALVFINVLPVNDPPRVRNEYVSLCENTAISGNILFNDADTVENTPMVARVPPVAGPAHGTLLLNTDGSYTYTPLIGFTGKDEAVVLVCDSGYPLPAQCLPDTIFITVTGIIRAFAGDDQQVCNALAVNLTGSPPATGTGNWSQLSGPDTATITPQGSAIATAGGLIPGQYMFLYTITNGDCNSSDTLVVNNLQPPSPAIAGAGQQLCLQGTGTATTHFGATPPVIGSGSWSQVGGPTTAFLFNTGDPNSLVGNLAAGDYRFRWTVTNSVCPAVSDSVLITVSQRSAVNAGADYSGCGSQPVSITGSAADNYITLSWITTGNGLFDNPGLLHPVYTPGTADTGEGTARLILTATSSAGCPSSSDTMVVVLSKPPVAIAGPDSATCSLIPVMLPGAKVLNSGSITWTHNGPGLLAGAMTLAPVYSPAAGEEGTVKLVLTAYGTAGCSQVSSADSRLLMVYNPVTADAGADQSITAGKAATLAGSAMAGSGNYSFAWEPARLFADNTLPQLVTFPIDSTTTFVLSV
ncbi:MAG: Ig-like domain-containing protein, partial [Bacteroidota bacterium]